MRSGSLLMKVGEEWWLVDEMVGEERGLVKLKNCFDTHDCLFCCRLLLLVEIV